MITVGVLMLLLVIAAGIFWIRGTLFRPDLPATRVLLWVLVFSVLGPQIANQAGWFAAEIGRQPWIVYDLLKTGDALSKVVTANQILASLIMFTFVYLLLFAVFIFLLTRKIQHGPDHGEESDQLPESWKDVVRHAREARA
jgi:cytochrome d ubiquinol oxidase subunit I